jgi:hypothetical protein
MSVLLKERYNYKIFDWKSAVIFFAALIMTGCKSSTSRKNVQDYESLPADNKNIVSNVSKSGSKSCLINSESPYGPGLKFHYKEIEKGKIALCYIDYMLTTPAATALLVVSITDTVKNENVHWNALPMRNVFYSSLIWEKITVKFGIPSDLKNPDNLILFIYPWNNGKDPVYVDNLVVDFVQ